MILPLTEQVIDLNRAEKMKELGFPQESLFYWILSTNGEWQLTESKVLNNDWLKNRGQKQDSMSSVIANGLINESLQKKGYSLDDLTKAYAAYTPAELGEILPIYAQFEKQSLPFVLRIEKEIGGEFPDEYVVVYVRYSKTLLSEKDYQERGRSTNKNLANAMADMAIYLKEEGII